MIRRTQTLAGETRHVGKSSTRPTPSPSERDVTASSSDIIADLNSLTETEVEQDGKRFLLRSPPRPAASLALRAAGVALPPTVRQLADD